MSQISQNKILVVAESHNVSEQGASNSVPLSAPSCLCVIGRSLVAAFRSLSPFGTIARLKGDVCALRHALREGDFQKVQLDRVLLAESIKGRLFASLVFSDACAYSGVVVGSIVQCITASPFWGLWAGTIGGYLVAIASFQVAYGASMFRLYRGNSGGLLDAVKRFELDVLPIHIRAFYASLVCYAILMPICIVVALLMQYLPVWLQRILPISVVEMTLAITFFDLLFIKSMSVFNSEHAATLAARYSH